MFRKWLILVCAIGSFQTVSSQLFLDVTWLIIDAAYSWERAEVESRYTTFGGKDAIMYGIKGGWDVGDKFSSGIGMYYSNHTFDFPRSQDYYSMDYFYTSFFLEYHHSLFKDITVSVPLSFGYGTIHLDGNAFNFVPDAYANMFIVEPGVMINWYPFSWMRLFGGGAFRFNSGTYLHTINNNELSAPSGVLGIGFGRYY